MATVRRGVRAALAAVGLYYVYVGALTVTNVTDVTNRWIQLSGDRDFRFDVDLFAFTIGFGAVAVTLLGVITFVGAVRALRGRQVGSAYWLALLIASPLVHFPWFIYRFIGGGWQPENIWPLCMFAIRSTIVCALYVAVWAMTRGRHQPIPNPHSLATTGP